MNDFSVEVKNLTVQFGDFKAVNNVSFTVNKGEIFGFLGANGAGKTTTIRVLCGLLIPSSGSALVAGLNLHDGLEPVKARVGYMSQRFTLYQDLTVRENMVFTAALRKIPSAIFEKRLKDLFAFIGFEQDQKTMVRELPGGLKQEVSLVAAMLHDPDIIFLDEPTAGVTPTARARFWALIRQLSERGKTVFVTTHYMDEAEQCGRIALMRTGEVIALDTPARLKQIAFPEPLFEITPLSHSSAGWLEELQAEKSVLGVKPYGMRYHAIVRDLDSWNKIAEHMSSHLQSRQITPSLEDVFIRLVEGDSR